MKESIFKSVSFWFILIAFIISIFIIFISPYLFDSFKDLSFRLLIAFSIFFGTIIVILLSILFKKEETQEALKEKREQRELEEEFKQIINEKVKKIKFKFDEAIKIIKKSSLYVNKRKAKYELPWYLVIGNSGEGKTTLLDSSGLDFPLNVNYSERELIEERNSNEFQWYFTEESVFIDVPGNYIEQKQNPEDKVIWKEFLKLFAKKRWRRPVNGIILTVSVETLLEKSEKELEQYAKDLRDRFDEISKSFMSNIPIYLLITKSDQVVGFNEYFASISHEEKEEIFGVTFDNKNKNIDTSIVKPEFEELLKRLNSAVLDKMHYEWESAFRSRIFLFCDNLAELFERTKLFVDIGFSQTRYREPLKLRGIYFTSTPGEYNPHALVDSNSLDSARSSTKGLFIKKVLKDIIFPEANNVAVDKNYKKSTFKNQFLAYILAFTALGAISLYFVKDFLDTNTRLTNLEKNLASYEKSKNIISKEDNFKQTIAAIDKIYKIKEFEKKNENDKFWNLLFYKVDNRAQKLEELYYNDLEKLLIPKVALEVERNIRKDLKSFDKTWNNTKAYIMLNNKKRRDKQYLKTYMENSWKNFYKKDDEIQKKLNYHWDVLLKRDFKEYEINQRNLKLARKRLTKLGSKTLTYKGLRTKFEKMNLKDFRFSQVLGNNVSSFTGSNYTIPGFYTKEGYEKLMKEGRGLTSGILQNNWVIGNKTDLSNHEVNEHHKQILNYYFRDYKKYWINALSKLKIPKVSSVTGLNKQLEMLSSVDSPTIAALRALKENTEIYSPKEKLKMASGSSAANTAINRVVPGGKLAKDAASAALNKLADAVDDKTIRNLRLYFKPYNALLDKEFQPRSTLKSAVEKVNKIYETMSSVSGAVAPRQEAFNLVSSRVQGNGQAIVARLGSLPAYVKRWYSVALKGNWNLLLKSSKSYLSSKYKEEVLVFYNERIRNKYPFNRNANTNVRLDDFTDFFKPDGIMDKFYKNYISNFAKVNADYSSYNYKKLDGNTVGINKTFMQAVLKAHKIRKIFFRNDGTLGFDAAIKPHDLSSNLATMEFTYDDQTTYYEHGPIQNRRISWPPQSLTNNLKFKLYDLTSNNVVQKDTDGDWAFFKMIDKFSKRSLSNDAVVLSYSQNSYTGSFYLKGKVSKVFNRANPLNNFYLKEGL